VGDDSESRGGLQDLARAARRTAQHLHHFVDKLLSHVGVNCDRTALLVDGDPVPDLQQVRLVIGHTQTAQSDDAPGGRERRALSTTPADLRELSRTTAGLTYTMRQISQTAPRFRSQRRERQMRTSISGLMLALLPAAPLLMTSPAQAGGVALEFTSSFSTLEASAGAPATLGWSFTTTQAITVDALDALNVDAGGSVVDLWSSTGTLLASGTVLSTDPNEGSPMAFFEDSITPVSLAAGKTYYIDESVTSIASFSYYNATGLTTNSAITYDAPVSALGVEMDPTSDFFVGLGATNGYFGPNFDIAASPTAPEPANAFLFLAGCCCLALLRLRAAKKTAGSAE